ncbi:hypothetical protein M8998_06985 [Sphingobacterium sp. lm-10]|uniref:hypothetical protein n=1 Tax=Sphingobacterium sp. lm-10 TaxID=2944904 RepID=UPI0020201B52|nr:hypothetical protein [Sphingobacterium sp. lm-10]MCL7987678.1 hypothetical protein [Sphingobacterium sp. lm-10]
MKDLKPHKQDPEKLDNHPYNCEDEEPYKWDKYLKYAVKILFIYFLVSVAYRLYQGENFFDIVGGFLKHAGFGW